MNRDEVLKVAGDPSYWMTRESQWRLSNGGNCKGAVPVHGNRSSTAIIPLYTEAQFLAVAAAMYAKGVEDMRERAAALCQKIEVDLWARYKEPTSPDFCSQHTEGKSDGATECYCAIRALPTTNTEGEQ